MAFEWPHANRESRADPTVNYATPHCPVIAQWRSKIELHPHVNVTCTARNSKLYAAGAKGHREAIGGSAACHITHRVRRVCISFLSLLCISLFSLCGCVTTRRRLLCHSPALTVVAPAAAASGCLAHTYTQPLFTRQPFLISRRYNLEPLHLQLS